MQRTISAMVGKGSVSHNSRKFIAENVDGSRTCYNEAFCNKPIRQVYHELFDDALQRYNKKQTRSDRCIADYYEKIRSSKQEKPFHELILQIGDKDNMGATTDNGELARMILRDYYDGFQERNPYLRVFSAHLHMDEATPHLHIDFVPHASGSKRGLDTRVSLKQALTAQGFHGGKRGDTEWSQWVQAEKEMLALVMERYGVQWERKGTHEKHLSVMDYKKQEREKELAQLESDIADHKKERAVLAKQVEEFDKGIEDLRALSNTLDTAAEYQLPELQGMMSAKNYKAKFADPLIARLKALLKKALTKFFQMQDRYHELDKAYSKLYRTNERLTQEIAVLHSENADLRDANATLRQWGKEYALLKKAFGKEQVGQLLERAREMTGKKARVR